MSAAVTTARRAAPFIMTPHEEYDALGPDPALQMVWLTIKRRAAWTPRAQPFAGRTFRLARGQLVTTQRALAGLAGVSRAVARRCLGALERLGLIATTSSEEATVITIAAAAETPARSPAHPAPAETPAAQGFRGASESDAPTGKPGKKIDTRKNNSNPTPQVARAYGPDTPGWGEEQVQWEEPSKRPANDAAAAGTPPDAVAGPSHRENAPPGPPAPVTPDAAAAAPPPPPAAVETLRYAQVRLARIVAPHEALDFVATWAASPWLTEADVRAAVDWIAAHPRARLETRSVNRVFHLERVRREYARWDRDAGLVVAAALAAGASAEEAAEQVVALAPSCDPAVTRAYALATAARLRQDEWGG